MGLTESPMQQDCPETGSVLLLCAHVPSPAHILPTQGLLEVVLTKRSHGSEPTAHSE